MGADIVDAPKQRELRYARRLSALIGSVSGLGMVVVVLAAAAVGRDGISTPEKLLVCFGLAAGVRALPLRVRFGSDEVVYVAGEIPLVLGLWTLGPTTLLVVTWLGVAVAYTVTRRGPIKTIYNAGANTLATLPACALFTAVGELPGGHNLLARGLVAAAAALVFNLLTDLAASAAIAISQQRPLAAVVAERFWLHQMMCLVNVAVTLTVLALAHWDYGVVLVLPVGFAVLHRAYAGSLSTSQEHDVWQRLDAGTRELNQLDRSLVVSVAATRALGLFRADAVDVIVTESGVPWLVRVTASDVVSGPAGDFPPPTVAISRQLRASETDLGELRLGFNGSIRLTDRESRALSTYAHAVSAALLNADLYEQMRAHAERKAHEAAHDPLTGLANRTVLLHEGATAVEEGRRTGRVTALLLLDLDHFKEVNDTLGHDAGDVLLCEVARRLARCVRDTDTVVRLGGDEFAVLVPGLRDTASAMSVASSVAEGLAAPIDVDGLHLPVEWSIGVACAPEDAGGIPDLLRCADIAMYQAKRSALWVTRYRAELDPTSFDRLSLVSELPAALLEGQLVLHFQPKVDLGTGAEVGVEALVRWQHPRRGLLGAEHFVSLAEQSGLVHGFTTHVLDLALAAARRHDDRGRWSSVAVNLSARNLLDRNLPKSIAAALERHGICPGRLILEITETVILSELEVVDRVLEDLRRLGVKLSVDDFGTGYSSLTFLSRTRLDEVKIDRSFVANMLDNPGDAAIVRAILELAHALGMRVVAEGVETIEQEAALVALGCDMAQGFAFGRAAPAEDNDVVLAVGDPVSWD